MITLTQADEFFREHPLYSRYMEFAETERMAAVQTAARDVAAALRLEVLPETVAENILAAVCEQAIFLLLNVQVLTGSTAVENSGNLSPRAYGLLAASLTGEEGSSDSGTGSGSSGSGDDSSGEESGENEKENSDDIADKISGELSTGSQTAIKCINQFRLIRG